MRDSQPWREMSVVHQERFRPASPSSQRPVLWSVTGLATGRAVLLTGWRRPTWLSGKLMLMPPPIDSVS